MYQYQQTGRYFAQIAGGLEEEGADELRSLGATAADVAYRGVYFEADTQTAYRANYCSRLATRVLAPLLTFDCHSDRYLYKTARDIRWTDFIAADDTFAIAANVSNSRISHSKFAALRLKDAIVDEFRARYNKRPSVDRRTPDLALNLHIDNNRAVISVDMSGGSLHRRGYRKQSVEAPIQETVAAAIIRWTDWKPVRPIYDPMCGSGTLLAEALMSATGTPAGYLRERFGFERLPDFDSDLWREVKAQADAEISGVAKGLIAGSDVSEQAVSATRKNLAALPHGKNVAVQQADFFTLPGFEDTTIVFNPPYGRRLGRDDEMAAFYKSVGDFLKQRCTGSTAFVYFGKREWIKSLGLRASFKRPLVNGALDGRLVKYELY